MNQRLTRRRFGQLTIAGTTAAVLSQLATSKTFAQAPPSDIVGVRLGPPRTEATAASVISRTDTGEASPTEAPSARPLVLQSLGGEADRARALETPQIVLQPGDVVTGFTFFNGTFVLAITPMSPIKKDDPPTRLMFLSTPPRTLTVPGLGKQEELGSLVGTNDGRLLGLVVKKNRTPPSRLVEINVQNGAISSRLNLPENQRFSNLAQCPDGKLYTTTVGRRGETSLAQLDLEQKKPIILAQLKVNNTVWNNGLDSLVCSPTGQLFAFGALRYETSKSVYLLDPTTGALTQPTEFDVAKIAIRRG